MRAPRPIEPLAPTAVPVCSRCGAEGYARKGYTPEWTSWRRCGVGWEHRCPDLHPQAGHVRAPTVDAEDLAALRELRAVRDLLARAVEGWESDSPERRALDAFARALELRADAVYGPA